MSGYGWRPHIESALCLSVPDFVSKDLLRTGSAVGSLCWQCNGKEFASIGYRVTVGDTAGELCLEYACGQDGRKRNVFSVISLSSRPLPYGGRYWYMHCPCTGRRARKLYKFPGVEHFVHRTAINPLPTYATQRVSGFYRVAGQRWAIRHKLGDAISDLSFEPIKPKWMRRRTFERYAARDNELAIRDNEYLLRLIGRLHR